MTPRTSRRCSVAERRHTKQRQLHPDTPRRRPRSVPTRRVITPAPSPAPVLPPWPQGNLDAATAEQIAAVADQVWPRSQSRSSERRTGMRRLLKQLAEHPGVTWQDRWLASGLDVGTTPV